MAGTDIWVYNAENFCVSVFNQVSPIFHLRGGKIKKKVFLGLPNVHNLKKNSLNFKLLAFWRKYTPFIDQKCTYEKVTKKLGRALPLPLIWTTSKSRAFFFRETFPHMSRYITYAKYLQLQSGFVVDLQKMS